MIELNFPKEILNANSKFKRITIMNKSSYYKHINANISACNLFTTVYNHTEFGEKYPHRPNYDTAIIDRLWFDFDLDTILEDKTVVRNDCYGNMKKLHEWALKHDYKHICRYTGSGFDVTIFTTQRFIKNKKDCIKNAVIGICDKFGIKSDEKTLGDIARVCRVTNSYNFKSKAKRFCIPLTQELIDSGHKEIRKIAKKQKFYTKTFGTKLLDLKKYDYPITNTEELEISGNDNIGECHIDDLCDNVPVCIRYLLSKKTPNYEERRIIIVGLRELGFNELEIKKILHKYLDNHKFNHCIYEEGQLNHLYRSKKIIFPNQRNVMKYNACPMELGKYCENSKRGCMNYGR